jgi:hypothetical protein
MKALKSKLAKEILESGKRIPFEDGAKVEHQGKEYTVKIVPKASNKPKK